MSKARTLADFISDGSEFADGAISVAEVSGAAPTASPTFTGTTTQSGVLQMNTNYIQFTGNLSKPNVGAAIYRPAADSVAVVTNNQDRMVISNTEVNFNEDSQNTDFRIESDNNANMLFVDAGADHVNIGTSTDFGGTLNVAGVINQNRLAGITKFTDLSGDIVQTGNNNVTFASGSGGSTQHSAVSLWADDHSSYSGQIHLVGNTSNGGSVNAAGEVEFWTFNGSSYTLEAYMGPRAYVFNEGSRNVDFRVETDSRTHGLFLDASTNVLHVGGSTQSSSVGFVNCGGVTFSNGSATGGKFLSWDNEGSSTSQKLLGYWFDGSGYNARVVIPGDTSEFVFNDSSENLDFRIESDNNANMFTVDASSNTVLIGANAVGRTQLYVNGGITVGQAHGDTALAANITHGGTFSNMGGGSIEAVYGVQGTMRSATDIIIEYRATSWKSYSWEVHVSNTFGYCIVRAGGYNNGSNPTGTTVDLINGANPLSAASQVNQNNQYNRLKLDSAGSGVHTTFRVIYTQAGGDGSPRADRLFFTTVY